MIFSPAANNPDYTQQYWLWREEVNNYAHIHRNAHTHTHTAPLKVKWKHDQEKRPYSSNEERGSCQEADDAALVFTARKERWGRGWEGGKDRRLSSSYIIDFNSTETPMSTSFWMNAGLRRGHPQQKWKSSHSVDDSRGFKAFCVHRAPVLVWCSENFGSTQRDTRHKRLTY